MNSKIELGQFYTRGNPFLYSRVQQWFSSIPNLSNLKLIEPFAGSNSLVAMVNASVLKLNSENWGCFDIAPEAIESNLVPEIEVIKRDTIEDFPSGFDVAITNPPYLAKNSATRKGMDVSFNGFQDLFEVALNEMLSNCDWVAAIIPESFITRKIFTSRLEVAVSLNHDMFDDTEFPVCLALFSRHETADFEIWRGAELIGSHSKLTKEANNLLDAPSVIRTKFNAPTGSVGLWAIDDTNSATIRFLPGEEIASSTIKVTSRSYSRIELEFVGTPIDLHQLEKEANKLIKNYREITGDVFLTAFKGLRKDNLYRRRIDWTTSHRILNRAAYNLAK